SYRHMHGFGSHTFSMINDQNERVWVKFHMRSQQGIQNLTDEEAGKLVGTDRESHQRDLYENIEEGNFPKWKMYIQVMTEEEANNMPYNPIDLTKVWYKKDFPLIEVGEWELNRNPDNYFAEVEQAAFTPANIVPGIGFSPDKMLQGRLFSYGDTQRYRLGVNHHQIPVNQPKCPVHSFHRDGQMRVDGNQGSRIGYGPNSFGEWGVHPEHEEPHLALHGDAGRWDFREDDDNYYEQPGKLFNLMSDDEKERLFANTARELQEAERFIQIRHINNCYNAEPAYGEGGAKALGIPMSEVEAASDKE